MLIRQRGSKNAEVVNCESLELLGLDGQSSILLSHDIIDSSEGEGLILGLTVLKIHCCRILFCE